MRINLPMLLLLPLLTTGCRQDMHDQPKYQPLERSAFFEDGRASRPLIAATIAQGQLRADELLYTGKSGDKPATVFPFPITKEVLERGQQRFNIYCSPCHDHRRCRLSDAVGHRPAHTTSLSRAVGR